jgi:hypothetical protein
MKIKMQKQKNERGKKGTNFYLSEALESQYKVTSATALTFEIPFFLP